MSKPSCSMRDLFGEQGVPDREGCPARRRGVCRERYCCIMEITFAPDRGPPRIRMRVPWRRRVGAWLRSLRAEPIQVRRACATCGAGPAEPCDAGLHG